jgi:Mor family transcriptional regulator
MSQASDLFGFDLSEAERKQLLDLGVDDAPTSKWSRSLVDGIRVLEALFKRRGMEAEQAGRLAMDAVLELGEYHGGRVIYWPRGDALRTALRHAEIYRRAKAGNIEQLAIEYQLSVPQVYRVLRQQHALHMAKIQGNLFPSER